MYFNNSCTWDISFSHKVQMVKTKMNSFLNIPVYSLISPSNIKYDNKINDHYRHIPTSAIEKDDNNISTSDALAQMVWHRECLSCQGDSTWMLFLIKYWRVHCGP